MDNKTIKHLKELEAESIYVLREVAAQFERPVILFSGGKDSIVITYLAYKAFYPAKIPFPLLHIDTGHNFEETIQYRDELAKKLGAELIVGSVQESIDKGRVKEETGYYASRNKLQTTTLLDTLEEYKFDAAIGGARRDEEKARAKERFFSHRDEFGQWNPKNQRPELWNIFRQKEHGRTLPCVPYLQLDRDGCMAVYLPGEHPDAFALLHPRKRSIQPRRTVARSPALHQAQAYRGSGEEAGSLPHHR